MANATFIPTVAYPLDVTERFVTVYGTLVPSGTTDSYVTGGCVLSFVAVGPFVGPPVEVRVWSETVADQHTFQFLTGTTNANGLLAIFNSATGAVNAEISQAQVPAEIYADTKIRFAARFIKGR